MLHRCVLFLALKFSSGDHRYLVFCPIFWPQRVFLQNHLPGEPHSDSRPPIPGNHRPEGESSKTDWSASAEALQGPWMILLGAPQGPRLPLLT